MIANFHDAFELAITAYLCVRRSVARLRVSKLWHLALTPCCGCRAIRRHRLHISAVRRGEGVVCGVYWWWLWCEDESGTESRWVLAAMVVIVVTVRACVVVIYVADE